MAAVGKRGPHHRTTDHLLTSHAAAEKNVEFELEIVVFMLGDKHTTPSAVFNIRFARSLARSLPEVRRPRIRGSSVEPCFRR